MKVGILTYHRSINYGAYLQALCLQKELSRRTGYDVEIIDFDMASAAGYYKSKLKESGLRRKIYNIRRYMMFTGMRKYLPLSEDSLVTDDIDEFNRFVKDRYDLIVVGSDEVWMAGGFRPFPNPYWLPGTEGVRKVTCAVSGRNRTDELDAETKNAITKYLSDFEFVTVRDFATGQFTDSFLPEGRRSVIICDPTLAYDFDFDREEGRRLLHSRFHTDPGKKVIAVMDSTGEIVRHLEVRKDIQFISLYSYYPGLKNNPDVKPEEWVQIIAASDAVVTAFFHGMCIALKSDTPFLFCEERDEKNEFSKGYDLLKRNGLEDHYVNRTDKMLKEKIEEFVDAVVSGQTEADFGEIRKNERAKFDIFIDHLTK